MQLVSVFLFANTSEGTKEWVNDEHSEDYINATKNFICGRIHAGRRTEHVHEWVSFLVSIAKAIFCRSASGEAV